MNVLVGSTNPVKVAATQKAFGQYFDTVAAEGVAVDSGVADQPIGAAEAFRGARNRAEAVRDQRGDAAYFVGIEGGLLMRDGRGFAFGAMHIMDAEGHSGQGASPQFELPPQVTRALHAGDELGDVIDRITGQTNTKKRFGAAGFFTQGTVSRKMLYVQGLTMALAPFLRTELYRAS